MKNKYCFDYLDKSSLRLEGEETIFFKMLELTLNGELTLSLMCIGELLAKLDSDHYYIAHNLVIKKGRERIFKGMLFQVKREHLIVFLRKAHENHDVRNFIISPVFHEKPTTVIYLDEDQIIIYE